DANRPRRLYGPWFSPHLAEAAALRRDRQFGRPGFFAVQLLSGLARRRPNWDLHKHDLHHINSGVRGHELLVFRRDIFGETMIPVETCFSSSKRENFSSLFR